jgi:hypothetical protein
MISLGHQAPVWGVAGGDVLNLHCSWDNYGKRIEENLSSGYKKEEGLPFKEISTKNISAGDWKLRYTVKGPATTNEFAVEISAKGRDELVVRNLPECKPKISLLSQLFGHTTAGS